jgi:hypothetical protein
MDELVPKPQKFAPLLVLSLVAAFLGPEAVLGVHSRIGGVVLGFVFFLIWIGLIIFAVRRFRKRGLWLLTGAPLALMVPLLSTMLILMDKDSK